MSLALIRSNLLTELANRGEVAGEEVEQKVREFLADPPGPWLPEEFGAPYELLERSIEKASGLGKRVLIRSARLLINNLYEEMKSRRLTPAESRELLGTMAIAKGQPSLFSDSLPKVLFFAINKSAFFWRKVTPSEDIVGSTDSDRKEFISSVWAKLPRETRKKFMQPTRIRSKSAFGRRKIGKTSKLRFANVLRHGDLVEIGMSINGKQQEFVVLRLSDRDNFLFSTEELYNVPCSAENDLIPWTDLGQIRLRDTSPRTIANAIPRRLDQVLADVER